MRREGGRVCVQKSMSQNALTMTMHFVFGFERRDFKGKHRHFDFRGVIYDVDFEFNNSEEWYQSIPKEVRPRKDQPFYHLLAESNEVTYEAYVSEQNLLLDRSKKPCNHPGIKDIFERYTC